jgi:hypothetical protein
VVLQVISARPPAPARGSQSSAHAVPAHASRVHLDRLKDAQ